MRFWKKNAAIVFAAVIICSFSATAFAAEDTPGDEWETEIISSVEEQSTSQSVGQQSDTSGTVNVSPAAVSEVGSGTVKTGDGTSNGALALGTLTAISLAAAGLAAASRRKKSA